MKKINVEPCGHHHMLLYFVQSMGFSDSHGKVRTCLLILLILVILCEVLLENLLSSFYEYCSAFSAFHN